VISNKWLVVIAVVVLAVLVATLWFGIGGFNKKKEEDGPIAAPPPPGAASHDELSTGLGQARGLDEGLAPSSVKWTRVVVLDEKRAIIAGDVVNETIALLTDDAGKTWRSFRSERDAWANWSAALDGSVVLGSGGRDGAPTPTSARVEAARLAFGALDGPSLTAPTPLFPTEKGPAKGLLQTAAAIPAVLSPDSAAMIVEDAPRKLLLVYGGKPGAEAVPPVKLPSAEKMVAVPYGRPPVMLSLKGKDLLQRPFPAANTPLDKPQKVASVATTTTLLAELSTPPACETGEWSFQRTLAGPKKVQLLGVSPAKIIQFALPEGTSPTTAVGCGAGKILVEAIAEKTGTPAMQATQPDIPVVVTCDLAGKCVKPTNNPFRIWPTPHKREIVMAATEEGMIGVMTARASDRWGVYLAQAGDGTLFERQRVIGEGTVDRGRIELGALVSFGKRALLLISADVTGTSRRGWFVLVSDDGGTSWNPP
jgi:hypothetical protein